MNKKDWAKVWDKFEEITGTPGIPCKKCGKYLPRKYDDWDEQQKLIQRLVNKEGA